MRYLPDFDQVAQAGTDFPDQQLRGGSGGVGSCTWGSLRDLGNIIRLRVVTMEAEPRILEFRGEELARVSHAYGTNGIITEVEMPLTAAYEWVDVIVGFDSFITRPGKHWAYDFFSALVMALTGVGEDVWKSGCQKWSGKTALLTIKAVIRMMIANGNKGSCGEAATWRDKSAILSVP